MSITPKSSNAHNNTPLSPNIIKDSSTGGAGVIAGELAAEDVGLISKDTLASHQYGSLSEENTGYRAPEEREGEGETDDLNGFALPKRQLYTVIGSLYMASFLAALDTTVVTTLLSVIASDLNAVENIAWIATAYLLSCSAFQPLFGKLSDIFGRKVLLVICCAFFGVGCCICVTDSLFWLVFGRFITGCGGSGLTTLGTITMSDLIPLRERGLYQGLANICFGLGAASGGIIGGAVADYFGWKYVFVLQVPLAAIVGVAIYSYLNLPAGSPGLGSPGTEFKEKLKRVDFLGAFLLVSAFMSILTAASMGGKQLAYSSPFFITLIIVSAALLVAFVYVETYVSSEPIIPMEVMTERTVLASSLSNWFYTMGVFAYLFYVPLFFQAGMGFSATQGGERLIPNFFAVSCGSVGAGLYMRKTGRYYKLTVAVGLLSLLGMIRIILLSPKSSLFTQFTILLIPGLGYSCMLTVTLLSLIAAVPVKYQACTTSIQYTFRATGSTLGVAIASAVFQNVTRSQMVSRIHALVSDEKLANDIISRALENTSYAKEAPKIVQHAIMKSYQLGCRGTFIFSTVTIALGYFSSLFMREHVLHTKIERD
ncbi:Major Facilitator Superfamily protein [Clavispora lusitaniae]|uniref:Major Facilitator Superfamily protein n=1 Tax=Clavispora lusitaniae TaxID=36911 RepID=UPI00202BF940|nr:Major Facilitator Superfamily protein [Clavispora lusitaniae]